jgi:UDP-glucuronate decarboxylase
MLELAELVIASTGSSSKLVKMPLPLDDPRQRRPDISKAISILDWQPRVELTEGIERTSSYFSKIIGK